MRTAIVELSSNGCSYIFSLFFPYTSIELTFAHGTLVYCDMCHEPRLIIQFFWAIEF